MQDCICCHFTSETVKNILHQKEGNFYQSFSYHNRGVNVRTCTHCIHLYKTAGKERGK